MEGERRDSRSELDRLMRQYGSGLLRMCALYLRDASLAQDAVQETFLKAYRHWGSYRGEASEKTWLTRIAMNVCRDILRTPWLRHMDRRVDLDSLPEGADDFAFPDDTVLAEVMALPEKYRAVILLRYYQDMKLNEVAAALRLPLGTVRSRLNRANALLREALKEWYDEE